VNSRGCMYVSSGGTALNIAWTPFVGSVYVADGACATFASQVKGCYYGSSNVLLSSGTTMYSKVVSGSMYVFGNGIANSTTVNSGSDLYVFSGGTANSTTVNSGGRAWISSGGMAIQTTVNNGWLSVACGGVAADITVNNGGGLHVSSGG